MSSICETTSKPLPTAPENLGASSGAALPPVKRDELRLPSTELLCWAPVPRDFAYKPKTDEELNKLVAALGGIPSERKTAEASFRRLSFSDSARLFGILDAKDGPLTRNEERSMEWLKKTLREPSREVGEMILNVDSYMEDKKSQALVIAVLKGGFGFPVTHRNPKRALSEVVLKPHAITAEQGENLFQYFVACVEKTGQVSKARSSSTPDGACDCSYSYQTMKNGSTVRLMLSQWKPDQQNAFSSFNYIHVFRMPTANCPVTDNPACVGKDGKGFSDEDIKAKKIGMGMLLGTRSGD